MRMYIYTSLAAGKIHEGRKHEKILVARETVRGRIYTSLVDEEQIEWVGVERIKDVYIRPWLLGKIRSARKGLRIRKRCLRQSKAFDKSV